MIGGIKTKINRASLRAIEKLKALIQQRRCPGCGGRAKSKVAVEVESAVDGLSTTHYNKRFTYLKCLGKNSRRKKCGDGKWFRLAFSPHSRALTEKEADSKIVDPFADSDQVREGIIDMPKIKQSRILKP